MSATGQSSERDAHLARQFFEGTIVQTPGQLSSSHSHMELLQHSVSNQRAIQPSHQPSLDSGLQHMWLQRMNQPGLDRNLSLSSAWRDEFGSTLNSSQRAGFQGQLGSNQNPEELQSGMLWSYYDALRTCDEQILN